MSYDLFYGFIVIYVDVYIYRVGIQCVNFQNRNIYVGQ